MSRYLSPTRVEEIKERVSKLQKLGYWLFGLSFIAPNYDLRFVGVKLAIDSALMGASNVIVSFGHVFAGVIGLIALGVNFSVIPGNGMTRNWRIATVVFVWLIALAPYRYRDDHYVVVGMIPPYLMWATAISILNLCVIRKEEKKAVEPQR